MVQAPLIFLSQWREFLPCLALQKKNWRQLASPCCSNRARVAWHASFQHLEQQQTCNSAHEQTSLSNDTIDSVLHREVGRAKDLSAPPRIKFWHRENYIWHVWDQRVAGYRNSYCTVCLVEKEVENFHTEKAKAWIRYNERFKSLTRLSPVRY